MIDCREALMLMCGVEQIRLSIGYYTALDSISELPESAQQGKEQAVASIDRWLEGMERSAATLPLSRSFRFQLRDVAKHLKSDTPSMAQFSATFTSVSRALIAELGEHSWLLIPKEDRSFFDQTTPLFGEPVLESFPSASGDITAAGRCFALDEHTACVFHLMRATERGLHALHLHLNPNANPTYENWQNIIEQIEKEIRLREKLPRGHAKTEQLKMCAEAAVQFLYFKDAWRNHVSHSRETYDRHGATKIMNAVREFLRHLSENEIDEKLC